jgi:hypothetical protein
MFVTGACSTKFICSITCTFLGLAALGPLVQGASGMSRLSGRSAAGVIALGPGAASGKHSTCMLPPHSVEMRCSMCVCQRSWLLCLVTCSYPIVWFSVLHLVKSVEILRNIHFVF